MSVTLPTIVAPSLCSPVILGLPFLVSNSLIVDPRRKTVIDQRTGVDLFNIPLPVASLPLRSPMQRCKHKLSQRKMEDEQLVRQDRLFFEPVSTCIM